MHSALLLVTYAHTLGLCGDAADIGDIAYLKDTQGKQIN